ncbi:MAG: hypothetical protein PHI22_00065 [Bacilli bacterium]|nr:hypothetical protein [Bacilli bacterium]MDD4298158.1 hypothetical protein [Bacilli bacterium]
MLARVFFFLVGFGLMVIGFVHIIIYMNFMTVGYSFNEYVNFIIRSSEFAYTIVGFIIINLCIFVKGGKKGEICI